MLDRADLQALIRAELASMTGSADTPTVAEYAERWLSRRRAQGVASVDDDDTRLQLHILPHIGHLRLGEVRPRTIAQMLGYAHDLAPRSVLNVYGTLRVMFGDAVRDDLLGASPCILQRRRGELPRKCDRDPRWRTSAVFEIAEVRALLTCTRIPVRRRTLYALELLGGLRINEITPRRWADYRPDEPLNRLTVASGYDPKHHAERPTPKSGFVREMPVHPTLATYLDAWWKDGWGDFYGRQPEADDLIIPAVQGDGRRYLSSTTEWKRLQSDLRRLGLRHRRQHDSRRTFVSLARAGGASKDLLHWCTHGPEDGDIMDLYTQPPWRVLCEQVQMLRIEL